MRFLLNFLISLLVYFLIAPLALVSMYGQDIDCNEIQAIVEVVCPPDFRCYGEADVIFVYQGLDSLEYTIINVLTNDTIDVPAPNPNGVIVFEDMDANTGYHFILQVNGGECEYEIESGQIDCLYTGPGNYGHVFLEEYYYTVEPGDSIVIPIRDNRTLPFKNLLDYFSSTDYSSLMNYSFAGGTIELLPDSSILYIAPTDFSGQDGFYFYNTNIVPPTPTTLYIEAGLQYLIEVTIDVQEDVSPIEAYAVITEINEEFLFFEQEFYYSNPDAYLEDMTIASCLDEPLTIPYLDPFSFTISQNLLEPNSDCFYLIDPLTTDTLFSYSSYVKDVYHWTCSPEVVEFVEVCVEEEIIELSVDRGTYYSWRLCGSDDAFQPIGEDGLIDVPIINGHIGYCVEFILNDGLVNVPSGFVYPVWEDSTCTPFEEVICNDIYFGINVICPGICFCESIDKIEYMVLIESPDSLSLTLVDVLNEDTVYLNDPNQGQHVIFFESDSDPEDINEYHFQLFVDGTDCVLEQSNSTIECYNTFTYLEDVFEEEYYFAVEPGDSVIIPAKNLGFSPHSMMEQSFAGGSIELLDDGSMLYIAPTDFEGTDGFYFYYEDEYIIDYGIFEPQYFVSVAIDVQEDIEKVSAYAIIVDYIDDGLLGYHFIQEFYYDNPDPSLNTITFVECDYQNDSSTFDYTAPLIVIDTVFFEALNNCNAHILDAETNDTLFFYNNNGLPTIAKTYCHIGIGELEHSGVTLSYDVMECSDGSMSMVEVAVPGMECYFWRLCGTNDSLQEINSPTIQVPVEDTNVGFCIEFIDNGISDANSSYFYPIWADSLCSTLNEQTALVSANVFLEGPYDASIGEMTIDLQAQSLIPYEQPYNVEPYLYNGFEQLNNIHEDMVDWVLVELRTGEASLTSQATTVVAQRAGVLLKSGQIVDTDFVSPIEFKELDFNESYHIVIRHRNHLDIISSEKIEGTFNMEYDFRFDGNKALGIEQMKLQDDGNFALFSADYNGDGLIQATDFDLWKEGSAINSIYINTDGNLDGVVQITDYDLWFINKAKLGMPEIRFEN